MTSSPLTSPPARWADLFSRPHLSVVTVLAGGIGLYAMNLYFTAALLPTIIAEIGGQSLYAWVSTGYLIAAVATTMCVSRALSRFGARTAYIGAYALFAVGTVIAALSPVIGLLIAGRVVQGLGAGLLTGLGYAVFRTGLPEHLWTRATGLISMMFGVGTLCGPALGGLAAQWGAWRPALWTLVACAVILAVLSARALPGRSGEPRIAEAFPVLSLVTLIFAAAAFSVSGTLPGALTTVAILAGCAFILAFFIVDSRTANGVLPRLTYQRGNALKWVYLTVAGLSAGVMIENFLPLWAQDFLGLNPLIAGFIGAVLSAGWVLAQFYSVNLGPTGAAIAVRTGPLLLTGGLIILAVLLVRGESIWWAIAWIIALLIAGAGVGVAFPHLSVAALRSTGDEGEGTKAAAALSTIQLISYALTSAIAGTLLGVGTDPLTGAQWAASAIVALTAVAGVSALLATRRR